MNEYFIPVVRIKPRLLLQARLGGSQFFTVKGVNMKITLADNQQVTFTIPQPVEGLDALGNAVDVTFTGPPVWEVSDTSKFTLEVSADGLSATAKPVQVSGNLGTAQLTVKGGTNEAGDLIGMADLESVAGQAVAIQLNAGTPEPLQP